MPTDLPADIQAEVQQRRRRWLLYLAAMLATALFLSSQGQYPLGRLVAGAAVIWSMAGLVWVNIPARDFLRAEALVRAEMQLRDRQD